MDYQKAFDLFNLELKRHNQLMLLKDFNLNELKKAWRLLSKIYHPDNICTGNTKKFIQLDEAFKNLEKGLEQHFYFKMNIKREEQDVVFIKRLRKSYLEKIVLFKEDLEFEEFHSFHSEVKAKIKTFEIVINGLKDENKMKEEYQLFLQQIYNIYEEFKKNYFKKFFIDENQFKEKINYNCSVNDFSKQMLYLNNKYSALVLLDKEILKYQDKIGFDGLQLQIKSIINFNKKGLQCDLNLEVVLDNVNKAIKDLFFRYYAIQEKLSFLKSKTIDNHLIKNIEFTERTLFFKDYKKLEEKIKLIENQIKERFFKRNLFVKVSDLKTEEEGNNLYLAHSFYEKSCKILEWHDNESFDLTIKEISLDYLYENFCLLESFFTEENKVFQKLENCGVLYCFGNSVLYLIDNRISVGNKEDFVRVGVFQKIREIDYKMIQNLLISEIRKSIEMIQEERTCSM